MRRTRQELEEVDDPAWPIVNAQCALHPSTIEVLPADINVATAEIEWLQVTARSYLGALALHCGGLLVDGGWLRILGSGHARCSWSLSSATRRMGWEHHEGAPVAIAVGVDVLGGIFAINGGAFGPDALGRVFYFAPESLDWECLNIGHTHWVDAMLDPERCGSFYAAARWSGWEAEVRALGANQGIHFWPPLWARESKPRANASRRAVNLDEVIDFELDAARQLG